MGTWLTASVPPSLSLEREREREAACSIISVLTQWGATLVIKIRERERESADKVFRTVRVLIRGK